MHLANEKTRPIMIKFGYFVVYSFSVDSFKHMCILYQYNPCGFLIPALIPLLCSHDHPPLTSLLSCMKTIPDQRQRPKWAASAPVNLITFRHVSVHSNLITLQQWVSFIKRLDSWVFIFLLYSGYKPPILKWYLAYCICLHLISFCQ